MQSVELVYLLKIIAKLVIQLNESLLMVHVSVMMVLNNLRLYMVYVFLKIQMDQFVGMVTLKQVNNAMISIQPQMMDAPIYVQNNRIIIVVFIPILMELLFVIMMSN
jgi:hypothetical protein